MADEFVILRDGTDVAETESLIHAEAIANKMRRDQPLSKIKIRKNMNFLGYSDPYNFRR